MVVRGDREPTIDPGGNAVDLVFEGAEEVVEESVEFETVAAALAFDDLLVEGRNREWDAGTGRVGVVGIADDVEVLEGNGGDVGALDSGERVEVGFLDRGGVDVDACEIRLDGGPVEEGLVILGGLSGFGGCGFWQASHLDCRVGLERLSGIRNRVLVREVERYRRGPKRSGNGSLCLAVRCPCMSDDEHGIDIEEDTDLDTRDDEEDVDEEAKELADEGARERDNREKEREVEQESEVREEEAAEQENPDNHRDEEPFQS